MSEEINKDIKTLYKLVGRNAKDGSELIEIIKKINKDTLQEMQEIKDHINEIGVKLDTLERRHEILVGGNMDKVAKELKTVHVTDHQEDYWNGPTGKFEVSEKAAKKLIKSLLPEEEAKKILKKIMPEEFGSKELDDASIKGVSGKELEQTMNEATKDLNGIACRVDVVNGKPKFVCLNCKAKFDDIKELLKHKEE